MTGDETILLGRMSARIDRRLYPGDRCIIVAWPTGRDGRKLFASSALLNSDSEILAVAQATWLLVDRRVQLGE
jgi:acyl-CoA thioesterase FadM